MHALRLGILAFLCWTALVSVSRVSALTAPDLDLQVYAGLRITGTVGGIYSVDYVTNLSQADAWRSLSFLRLPASPYLWFDATAPASGRRFYRAAEMAPPTNMAFIPPGSFRMGSPATEVDRVDREGPQTEVTISRGYWIRKFEVTQAEYLEVMGSNPSGFKGDMNLPVEQVSWFNATNYCGRLTQQERVAGRIAANHVYRLPTEAEWEYACRALTSTRFSHGDDPDLADLANYAWYDGNSSASTHPVGQKLPNPWGLYDMHGNVSEWCQDRYGSYHGGTALDPQGPTTGSTRVLRGGLWFRPGSYSRSVTRIGGSPDLQTDGIGFRVVLVPGEP